MKKTVIFIILAIIAIALFLALGGLRGENAGESNSAMAVLAGSPVTTIEAGEYSADILKSELRWEADKPLISSYRDSGTIALSSGALKVASDGSYDGLFVIDMNSINTVSTGVGRGQENLTKHLKSADFFDVEQFPTSEIKISKIEAVEGGKHLVFGDLTIKGVSNPVIFSTELKKDGDALVALGEVEVDRTLWNIKYGSGRFFENLGDKMIDDSFRLFLSVTLLKK